MTNPITPSPELVQQWMSEIWHEGTPVRVSLSDEHIAARAAQWGADQELEACCEWFSADVVSEVIDVVSALRAARRPKPPTLKEQAFALLNIVETSDDACSSWDLSTIRRALEALDD
jgi:hypothetical protein